jgi:hypothetical protein
VDDDAIACRNTGCDLGLLAGLMADVDPCALGAVLDYAIDGPFRTVAEESTRGDLENIPTFPHHDPDRDPIGVAECRAR